MRIGIINDNSIAAERLRRVIRGNSRHEIAWVARSGEDAMARCANDAPEAILMDLATTGMDAVETTRRIMAVTPCAIIVVSANIDDNPAQVFEAMGAGAIDAVNALPPDEASGSVQKHALNQKLDQISKVITRPDSTGIMAHPAIPPRGRLVVIGASAGGPAAVAAVLGALPKDFNASVIIIQHVDPQFAIGLVDWLNAHSRLSVRLAEEGDHPRPGTVLVAAREEHLVFTGPARLGYTRVPVECSYRPSVDVFLKSVDYHWKGDVVAVLLTGMGRDGAEGMRILHASGHLTIAQDRQTSAVYGMPKAAVELKAASEILALDKIGPRLANIFQAV